MNYLWLLSVVLSLLIFEGILLFLKKKKTRKLKENPVKDGVFEKSTCLEKEDCWCCEYNLSKEKKEKLLEEFEDLRCGKSVGAMLKNE